MKKLLLLFAFAGFLITNINAQCVYTCSNYAVSSISYSQFPTSGSNVVPSFTPSADDGTVNVPIGFNFDYYCATYTAVNICSNGFIQVDYGTPINFGNPVYSQPAQAFPSTVAPDGIIALNMNDFDATTTGAITYTTIGTAPYRMFVVTYSNVPIWYNAMTNVPPTPVYNSGQIVLYETTNIIEVHSAAIGQSPNAMSQGMENTSGTAGLTVPGRSASFWTATNDAYRFAPYAPASPSSLSGTTNICFGTQADYSVTPSAGALSYLWNLPSGWNGTYTTSAISLPVGASGNLHVSAVYTCGVSPPISLSVTTIPAPAVAIASSSPVVCSGETIDLITSGAITYTIEPGTLIGNSPFSIVPDVTTSYTLYGTDANNCVSINNPQVNVLVNESPTVTVNSGSTCVGNSFAIIASGADSYVYSSGFTSVTSATAGIFTYSVVGTNTNGCSGDPAISTLTVVAAPSLTLSANKTTICTGETASITAGGADTYTWVNGPTTSIYTVNPIFNTNYTVTGTSIEGCTKTSHIAIAVSFCTGITENNTSDNFISVFPNPSSGEITVSIAEETTVEIYDLQGKLLFKQNMTSGDHDIDISSIASGQYFLKARDNQASHTIILIKE